MRKTAEKNFDFKWVKAPIHRGKTQMKKKIIKISLIVFCIFIMPITVFAHSGRTDSSGGHRDNKNKSGLGSYHYHCGGYPAHLHDGGVCPYTGGGSSAPSYKPPAPPSPSVSIKNHPTQLNVGDSAGLEYSIENAADSSSAVTSSNENVVRVNEDKTLTAVGEGTATITVSGSGASKTFDVSVKSVPVSSILINDPPSEIQLDTSVKLTATISPDNATDKSYEWLSDDSNVIEINQSGELKAKNVGSAIISCQTKNGVKTDVSIEVYEVFPEEIKVNINKLELECGESKKIDVTILPEKANNKHFKMESKNSEIVLVESDNTIKVVSDGSTELLVSTDNGITKEIPVTVYHVAVGSLEIDDSEINYVDSSSNVVDKDELINLKVKIKPENATYTDVKWESSNPDIIEVSENSFIIKGTGEATLTVYAHDGIKQSIDLKVVNQDAIMGGITTCLLACAGAGGFVLYRKKKHNHI